MAYKSLRNMTDQEALIYAQALYARFKSGKQDAITRQERYNAIYQALDPPDLQVDQGSGTTTDDQSAHSDSYLPVGAALVDSAVAQLFSLIFSTDNYLQMAPQDWMDHFQLDRVTAHMLTQHREMKFRFQVYKALQAACCFDYCVTACRWLLEPGYLNKKVKETKYLQMGKLQVPFQRVAVESQWVPDAIDRPDMMVFGFDRSYHDPDARNGFDDSEGFVDDRDESIEWLRNQEKTADRPWGPYRYIDELEKRALDSQVIDDLPQYADQLSTFWDMLSDDNERLIRRRVRVHRLWTRDHLVEWSHGLVLRRLNLSGWPLQRWVMYEKPNRFEGMGLLQRIERMQYDINADVNSRRDFKELLANPFGLISDELVQAEGGAPQVESGVLIPVHSDDVTNKLMIHQPGQNIIQDNMAEISQQIDIMQKSTQVSTNQMGSFASGRRPATEVGVVAQAALTADQVIAMKLEDTVLVPFYLQQFALNQLNMTETAKFLYQGQYGNQFYEVNPVDYAFNAQPLFECLGTISVVQDAVHTQQFMLAMDKQAMMPQAANWDKIFAEMWRRLVPKHYHEFVKDPTIPQHNVPAQIENQLIALGHYVEVSPLNNHVAHIQGHEAIKQTGDYQAWPEVRKMRLEQHLNEHRQAQQGQQSLAPMRPMQDNADVMRGLRPAAVA